MPYFEFAKFCQKVTKQELLSQPDSGLKSESSKSVNLIEKSDHSWDQDTLNIGLLQLDIVARTLSKETEKSVSTIKIMDFSMVGIQQC